MDTLLKSPLLLTGFLINLIIACLSFYSAWINLVQKRISNFGFDIILLKLASLIDAKQAKKIHRDPMLIRRMGILMLLFGIGTSYAVVLRLF